MRKNRYPNGGGWWPAFPSESLNAVLRHRSRTNVSRPRRRRRGRARYHKNEYTKRPHEVRVAHALSLRSVLAAGLLPARLIPGFRPWYVHLVSGRGGAPHDGTRQHDQVGWSGGGPHIVIGQYTFAHLPSPREYTFHATARERVQAHGKQITSQIQNSS